MSVKLHGHLFFVGILLIQNQNIKLVIKNDIKSFCGKRTLDISSIFIFGLGLGSLGLR